MGNFVYNEVVTLPIKVFRNSIKEKKNEFNVKLKKKERSAKKQGNKSFSHSNQKIKIEKKSGSIIEGNNRGESEMNIFTKDRKDTTDFSVEERYESRNEHENNPYTSGIKIEEPLIVNKSNKKNCYIM